MCDLAIVLMMLNHPKITKCFFEWYLTNSHELWPLPIVKNIKRHSKIFPEVETSATSTLQFSTSVESTADFLSNPSVRPSNFFLTSCLQIWIIFGTKLEDHKVRKLTEPDFPGKIMLINYSWKRVKNHGFWPFFQL